MRERGSQTKGTGGLMVRAIIRNGVIELLDPLPVEWRDGKELIIEEDTDLQDGQTLAEWKQEMDEAAAQTAPEEDDRFLKALAQIEAESKDAIRREWGLK
jgi:hypothetical protein